MPVRASGRRDAKVAVVGMAPAREEVATGIPFMGSSGQIFNESIRTLGWNRNDIYVTNVHDEFLAPGMPLSSVPNLEQSINRLKAELEAVRPNVIIPLGAEP